MKWMYELTDTYGGEPNYSWVKEGFVFASSPLSAVRKIKKELGLTGVDCRKENYGDEIVLNPYGLCQILFITQQTPAEAI